MIADAKSWETPACEAISHARLPGSRRQTA
jgi:hypothetical protein